VTEKKPYLKVPKNRAEEIRLRLAESGGLDTGRVIERDQDFIYLPVKNRKKVAGCEVVERKPAYKEKRPRSLREAAGGDTQAPTSFDIVGDIAILEFDEDYKGGKEEVADALLNTFSNISVVVEKSAKVSGEYRIRGIGHLAGEKRTTAVHTEYGCRYRVDVARDYFSPRLGTERMRVAGKVEEGERVLVLFAGVGPYTVLIAKKRKPKDVVAVELNPHAAEALRENARINKVAVKVVEGDAREVTPGLGKFDRIVMPLPKDAGDFLDAALPALKKGGVVHFYTFAHDEKEAHAAVEEKTELLGYKVKIQETVECGSYSPCLARYCVDFKAKK